MIGTPAPQAPTVGRVVHFFAEQGSELASDQPIAAIVTYVHSAEYVDLAVFAGTSGIGFLSSVRFGTPQAVGHYATWPTRHDVAPAAPEVVQAEEAPAA